jgi:hypothetical protein
LSSCGKGLAACYVNRASYTKVCKYRVALREQNILWLDIAVDDAVVMCVAQGVSYLMCNAESILQWKLFLSNEAVSKRFALDVRHHVVKEPIRATGVVEGQYVNMLETGLDLDLAEEALWSHRCGQVGSQDLDGNVAVMLQVLSEVDRGHATVADLSLNPVTVRECGAQPF